MEQVSMEKFIEVLVEGEEEEAAGLADALLQDHDPMELIDAIMQAAEEIGRLYKEGEYFLPELMCGAAALTETLDVIVPALGQGSDFVAGTIVIGAVEGDVHDIGKTIVSGLLAASGFQVHDLGTDVKAQQFVDAVREKSPDIVAASAYITTTAPKLKEIHEALVAAGVRDSVKYLIGGATVNRGMVDWAGADGYGEDAAEAVAVAKSLVAKKG